MKDLIKRILLQEGRVEDMKKRYPEHVEAVDFFVNNDPSGNNKYLQWMMKQVVKNNEQIDVVLSVTKKFHQNQQRLQKKDINQYKTIDELVNVLKVVGKSKGEQERKIKREGANVLFENDNVIALRPLNHKASCKYGAGTKWCVTMKGTSKYWDMYTKETSVFGNTNWYESEWIEERIEPNFIQRLLGKKPKTIKKEIRKFINHFPTGILYFVIFKRRVVGYDWDEEVQARIPKYETADPKNPMNKLALLYKPDRADFGDTTWSEYFREGDFMEMISDKLDAAHNNLSIFNALDKKVTLQELSREFGGEFSVPFRFIENDFQKERNKILYHLSGVLDKVFPLLGAEGSKNPRSWIPSNSGNLISVPTGNLEKTLDDRGRKLIQWRGGKDYKSGNW